MLADPNFESFGRDRLHVDLRLLNNRHRIGRQIDSKPYGLPTTLLTNDRERLDRLV